MNSLRKIYHKLKILMQEILQQTKNPACGFEFVVSDKGFNVEESREEAAGKEQEYKTYTSKINTSEEEIG